MPPLARTQQVLGAGAAQFAGTAAVTLLPAWSTVNVKPVTFVAALPTMLTVYVVAVGIAQTGVKYLRFVGSGATVPTAQAPT